MKVRSRNGQQPRLRLQKKAAWSDGTETRPEVDVTMRGGFRVRSAASNITASKTLSPR